MARLIDADELFNWGTHKLKDAVKYGNKDGNQQSWSYSTLMMYEVADEIFDAPTIDAVSVVRCKDCIYFEAKNSLKTQGICMCGEKEMNYGGEFYPFADDFCSYGKRKND